MQTHCVAYIINDIIKCALHDSTHLLQRASQSWTSLLQCDIVKRRSRWAGSLLAGVFDHGELEAFVAARQTWMHSTIKVEWLIFTPSAYMQTQSRVCLRVYVWALFPFPRAKCKYLNAAEWNCNVHNKVKCESEVFWTTKTKKNIPLLKRKRMGWGCWFFRAFLEQANNFWHVALVYGSPPKYWHTAVWKGRRQFVARWLQSFPKLFSLSYCSMITPSATRRSLRVIGRLNKGGWFPVCHSLASQTTQYMSRVLTPNVERYLPSANVPSPPLHSGQFLIKIGMKLCSVIFEP